VKVWVFTGQPEPQDRELLESYRRLNDRFRYEFVDPRSQPALAKRLEIKTLGDVVLEVPDKSRKQFVQNLSGGASDNPAAAGQRLSEIKLTSALQQVTSDRRQVVYFVQGHGERPLEPGQGAISAAVKLLGDRNWDSKPLVLAAAKEVPQNTDVVVVAGPQKPLLPAEVATLKEYLSQGGKLLLLIDPTEISLGLEPLLKDWGVDLDKRVVIDSSAQALAGLGPADAIVTQYGNHPITNELKGNISFYSLARPLGMADVKTVKNTELLYTSDRSWAESDLKSDPLKFTPGKDQQGPLVLGIALERPAVSPSNTPSPSPTSKSSPTPSPSPTSKSSPTPTSSPTPKSSPTPSPSPVAPTAAPAPSPASSPNSTKPGEKPLESYLVVIGNSTFATDGFVDRGVNGDVFLNSVRWLGQKQQQTLSIRPKEAKNRRITLSMQQATIAGWLSLVLLPWLGFGTAVFIWWKRR